MNPCRYFLRGASTPFHRAHAGRTQFHKPDAEKLCFWARSPSTPAPVLSNIGMKKRTSSVGHKARFLFTSFGDYIVHYRLFRYLTLVLLCFMVAACATAPAPRPLDPKHVATAKRFLHSWGAGDLVMDGFRRALEEKSKEQPGMAELARRAFASFKVENAEDLVSRIYARHLSQDYLGELARFTESRTGNRFFRIVISGTLEGKKSDDILRQFNADELTEALKFSQNESFTALTQALPAINRELAEEGRRLGETTMREYIKRQ